MDKKSPSKTDQPVAGKILLWVFVLLIAGSVGATFWRIMIEKDYVIEAQVDCDPYEKECFVWECDPESSVEGEACTGDPENDIWYYSIARRNAANIPLCDPETDENCDPWTCNENENDCEEILCSDESKTEEDVCNDPEQYLLDNPMEEDEAVECEEDDEECLAAESEEVDCEDPSAAETGGDEECLATEETEDTEPACDTESEDCSADVDLEEIGSEANDEQSDVQVE